MTTKQRFRYEMFVRVRDFGTANEDVFPESSNGHRRFSQVSAAVAAVEDHLTKHDRARAEAQRVKATTRAAVTDYMKAIARTARRATTRDSGINPFRMPTRKSSPAVLSRARLFIAEAQTRQEPFVALGLPPAFLSDFRTLVDGFDQAVHVRLNSRTDRRGAQVGIETALVHGLDAIRDLDVILSNTLRLDPVRLAAWAAARRIEGLGSSSDTTTGPQARTEPVVSRTGPAGTATTTAPVIAPVAALEKAS